MERGWSVFSGPMISRVTAHAQPRVPTASPPARTATQTTQTPTPYGESFFAAQDLESSIRRMKQLMGDAPLTNTFGARDQWARVDDAAKPSTEKAADSEQKKAR